MLEALSKDIQLLAVARHFDQARLVDSVRQTLARSAESSAQLNIGGAAFTFELGLASVPDRPDAIDGTVRCQLHAGTASQVSIALELDISNWSERNYVFYPAAVYNGNRFKIRDLGHRYPPIFVDKEDLCLNPPITITDVPHLETGQGNSRIQLSSGDMATPCVGFFSPARAYAMLLLTRQESRLGNFGLHLRESDNRHAATMTIEAPAMRSDGMYMMMNSRHPSVDRAPDWKQGDELTFTFRLFCFPAAKVQNLFDRFAIVRKDLSGVATLKHEIPFSAAWRIQEEKYNRENWRDDSYYAVGPAGSGIYGDWQLGWVGGAMNTLPLLLAGDALSRERAYKTLDWMFSTTQRPSGLLVGIYSKGKAHSDGFDPHADEPWCMTRKEGDALYFVAKHLLLLRRRDAHWLPSESWRKGLLQLADALLNVWTTTGQLGQFLNYETGNIIVGGSTAGAIVPAGLALAGSFFSRADYLAVAEEIAESFYRRDVVNGVTTGGPGEILNSPDSESCFAMLEAFVVLWEVTGKPIWLDRAREMARQACSWVHSYDYRFPPSSPFGQLDMRTTGSVWANIQNKHSAPGICTLSGDSLFKLFRATGDVWYLDLCRDIVHGTPQYLSRADRKVQMLRPGYMCERVNTCDWEYSFCPPGHVFDGSCWCEVSNMLSYVEVPGLYVNKSMRMAFAIDHVSAELLNSDASTVTVQMRNPTKFDADVRVMVEDDANRKKPMGQGMGETWPIVRVSAGTTVNVRL